MTINNLSDLKRALCGSGFSTARAERVVHDLVARVTPVSEGRRYPHLAMLELNILGTQLSGLECLIHVRPTGHACADIALLEIRKESGDAALDDLERGTEDLALSAARFSDIVAWICAEGFNEVTVRTLSPVGDTLAVYLLDATVAPPEGGDDESESACHSQKPPLPPTSYN